MLKFINVCMLESIRTYFSNEHGEIHYHFYIALFILALVSTYLFTMVLIKLSSRFGLLDKPDQRRIHQRAVPKLGGLAIFLSMALTFCVAALLHPAVAVDLLDPKSIAIFVGITVMLLLGIYDDLFQASWMWKFTIQIVAACFVISKGLVIMEITNPFGSTIKFYPLLGFVFTIVWLIGITNAVNLSDGLDGLSTGIVLIVAAVTFANSLYLTQTRPEQSELFIFATVTSITLIGASVAFLRFNFYPAKIFLGDTGSLFLGFLIACIAVRSSQLSTTTFAFVVPVIALGLPILDTVLAFLRRTAKRRNPFQADLQHIHHKMIESGLSHPETVLVLYAFCVLLGLAALVLALKKNEYAGIVLFVLTIVTLIGFKKFGILDITRLWGIHNPPEKSAHKKSGNHSSSSKGPSA